MRLSKHFSLGEMTKSQTALRLGLDNNPDPDGVAYLRTLCEQVLEPVRKHFDRPVIINSGFRAEAVIPLPFTKGFGSMTAMWT